MAKLTIQSSGKKPVSVEVTVTYDDGSSEIHREQHERIEIEADNIPALSITGTVYGTVRSGGDVSCGDIDGDVHAGTDVTCEDVGGDVRAGADVRCDDVEGNVRAGADLHCNDVAGNANAGADIECNYIAGSVTAGGEIASMGFEEDEEI